MTHFPRVYIIDRTFYPLFFHMQSKTFLKLSVVVAASAIFLAGCQQGQPSKSPEEVLKGGMAKLFSLSSYNFDIAIKGDLNGPTGEKPAKVGFNVSMNGGLDVKDVQDPKFNLLIDGSGNADEQGGAGTFEMRLNKDALFADLSKLQLQGEAALPKEFTDNYVGKWWKLSIPPGSLKDLSTSVPQGDDSKLTPEQKKVKDLFVNGKFFKDLAYVGNDDVKGEQSYHYRATFDKDAFSTFIKQAAESEGKTVSDQDMKQLNDSMKKFDFAGDVWVGITSGVLNQLSGDFKLTNVAPAEPGGTINVRVSLWGFNQPVMVTVPTGAVEFPVQQLLEGMSLTSDLNAIPSTEQGIDNSSLIPDMSIQPSDGSSQEGTTGYE